MTTAAYLGVVGLADKLGVTRHAVDKWLDRYPPDEKDGAHPFPAPDVEIDGVPGWAEDRLDEIRQWRAGMPGRGAGGGRPRRQPSD